MFLKSVPKYFAQAVLLATISIPAYALEFDVGVSSNAVFQGVEINDSTSVSLKVSEKVSDNINITASGKSIDYGGVFNRLSACYDSLTLTVSNYFMAYLDFVPNDERYRFLNKQ